MKYRLSPFALALFLSLGCATQASTDGAGGDDPGAGPGTGPGGGGNSACPTDCSELAVANCFEAFCNEDTGACETRQLPNGALCDDGFFCTDGDTCSNGQCFPGPARNCGTSSECGTAACNELADTCDTAPINEGQPCSSVTDVCADVNDAICQFGKCVGEPKDCSTIAIPHPQCQQAACDPDQNGQCVVQNINEGQACNTGPICDLNKTCQEGVCAGTPDSDCQSCAEVEPNNTYQTASTGTDCVGFLGALPTTSDIDYYQVPVTVAGSRIEAVLANPNGTGCPTGVDANLQLVSPTGTALVYDYGYSPTCPSIGLADLNARNLAIGTYTIRVSTYDAVPGGYLLVTSVIPPACGDGIVQPGEECDDGNTADNDTCSSTCDLTVFDCANGDVAVEVSGSNTPVQISDNTSVTSTVSVAQAGTVTRVGVQLDITHTWAGDLDIYLDAPAANEIELSTDNGSSSDNYTATVFSSAATVLITTASAPFTGVFLPEGNMQTIVNTAAAGTWTLRVADDASGDPGTLNSWTLHLCVDPP